jgi:phosphatidylinositol kinase/protein kinase (PI-3  family)
LQQIRTNYETQIEQINSDKAAVTQQLEEDVEQLESISQKYKSDLKLCEERNASAVEKLRDSEASKNTIVTGLQHENELLKEKLTTSETLLQTEKSLNADLRRDKESIQKQLELVTLRLPAPKVGFWARPMGRDRSQHCQRGSPLFPIVRFSRRPMSVRFLMWDLAMRSSTTYTPPCRRRGSAQRTRLL